MNALRNPKNRVVGAFVLLIVSTLAGVLSTMFLASSGYERVLMAISWGAIAITCVDILATTDTRQQFEDKP